MIPGRCLFALLRRRPLHKFIDFIKVEGIDLLLIHMIDAYRVGSIIKIQNPAGHRHLLAWTVRPEAD
ncbi:hypothetical protein D3C75_1138790 [compost metagenome]